ncbi:putative homoserine kinase type II (protein kinase fold) [Rubidibacter lacunae KORDI 51-2]|uniref:Putative homoserine kinase type II (Protein kinase fold) n=1 Tax=Rubidibacter lacunae KORDI 51-2 TaxID=582515 RepID=U5DAM7_9CHRO|nr:phosphotransferase [Rubidibacter lacunae]ERN41588.1 putative homoserine kinase type II (protein kinase fold) [Rubidibacter lacunae KORDI 51-2]
MSDRTLFEIQQLQFRDRARASQLLKEFLNETLPFAIADVTVRPQAVSLNSINGFLTTADGDRQFFKTHVEPQSIIHEYYNSTILAEAGYPVIQPIYSSTEWGKQLLIYDYFSAPSLFDVSREIELGKRYDADRVLAAQQHADDCLWDIYRQTLSWLSAEEHARSPVHQLFFHRLTGGRYAEFYCGKQIAFPGAEFDFERIASWQWRINDRAYSEPLAAVIDRAIARLNPTRADVPAIIGHGDAHNGNVFWDGDRGESGELIYFDPAFAGRHSPFLDLAKPLFHNVFAIWMYFPREIAAELEIRWELQGETLVVEHDFVPSELRIGFLRSKLEHVLKPLLFELRLRGWLDPNWRDDLKLALFCCPFLTMNLADSQKFPPEIALLGLAIAMEMAAVSEPPSRLDTELDRLGIGDNRS